MRPAAKLMVVMLPLILAVGLGAQKKQQKDGEVKASATPTSIVVTWTQSPNPACSPTPCPVTSNKLYRGTTSGGEGATAIASSTTPVTTFTDTNGLVQGQMYFYQVSAVNVNGESPKSTEASVMFGSAIAVPPNAPTGLTGVVQ